MILAVACGSDGEVETDGEPPACETLWQAEDGLDYGDPWEPPIVPDVGDIKFDLPNPGVETPAETDEFDDLEVRDINEWELDHEHNIYFRRATHEEIFQHGWNPDDVLIIIPDVVAALNHGAERLTLPLPLYPRRSPTVEDLPELHAVDLSYFGDFGVRTIIDRGRRRTLAPKRSIGTFAYFAPEGLSSGTHFIHEQDLRARLTSDREQALHVRGAGMGRAFSIRGPIDVRMLMISPPIAQQVYVLTSSYGDVDINSFSIMHPAAAGVVSGGDGFAQCTDGLDNDGDGVGDHCDYECHPHPDFEGPGGTEVIFPFENTKSFGLFGDLLYCSTAAEFWELELATIGFEASQFLNWVDGGEPDELNAFRSVVIACDAREPQEAAACHNDGACSGELEDYPLAGVGSNLHQDDDAMESGYTDFVWALVDWYVAAGEEPTPQLHAAVIAAQQNDPPGNFGIAGSASANLADIDYEEVGGAAVNVVAVIPHLRVAHELGHTMGLPHDTAFYVREGDETELRLPGFMNAGGGTQPVLGAPDPDEPWWGRNAQGVDVYQPKQIWTESVPNPNWPRSSGFGYTGCQEQTCEYFQNLTCNGTVCVGPLQ